MKSKYENQSGFTPVVVLLVLLIVAVVGFGGYYVYQGRHTQNTPVANASGKSTSPTSSSANSTTAKDSYAGWLSYTTKYEGLKFKYPSDWTTRDVSYSINGVNLDNIQVFPANQTWEQGVNVQFQESMDNNGIACTTTHEGNEDTLIATEPVSFLGQHDSIFFYSGGANKYDSSPTALSQSYVSASSLKDIAPSIPWHAGRCWDVILDVSSNRSSKSPTNPDYAIDKLIIESASH